MPTTAIETLTLRRAKGADIPALESLYRRSFGTSLRGDYAPSTMVAALSSLTRAQMKLVACGTYYVAEDASGQLVGAGGWSFAHPLGKPSPMHMAHVRHFAVEPSVAGEGIGGQILEASMSEAKASGARLMDCQATIGAVPFFTAHGFREVETLSVPVKPGMSYPATRLQKRL